MQQPSFTSSNPAYLDALYQSYREDPTQLDPSWRHFFSGFTLGQEARNGHGDQTATIEKEIAVAQLIQGYRSRAHLLSKTNPIRQRRDRKPRLTLEDFGLSEADLDTVFVAAGRLDMPGATLRQVLEALEQIYCGRLGFEYFYIRDPERLKWLKQTIEQDMKAFSLKLETKRRILQKLNEATVFEQFLHKKYVGQKRFSLEGGENTIPALDLMIRRASELGAEEVVIGMAHRGRLNVLANIIGKTYEQIFTEFEGLEKPEETMGDGDVKYHLGYTSHLSLESGKSIYLKLSPNPSHLEAVSPVVLGYTRAQIDDEYAGDFSKAVPILIHGDAALAGQGIGYELMQMSRLEGYDCGGTIHFVINNQIGFTTDFADARSSIYCSDLAKIIDAPVIHVNGDDAEAVAFASALAVAYRQRFHADVFIDMVCYRRHGHNESDEPKFTQPRLYHLIDKHPNPREIYTEVLIERGDVDEELARQMLEEYRNLLQERLDGVRQEPIDYVPTRLEEEWRVLDYAKPDDFLTSPETAISEATVETVAKALTSLPEGFQLLKKAEKILADRRGYFFESRRLDWACAEQLAMGSLLLEDKIVRLSGQDVIRGTFSHRHAMYFDENTNEKYCGLNHLKPNQKRQVSIFNSLLSEYGVLGFEYGYAMATPNGLILWEAQFGDFANGAQVIIDQFISSAESKWQRMNGLVMLLPHSYEGQGPEHSNARPERFLQLAADYNMIVANLTEPANYFHLLRRQLTWSFRKPCAVMSPKSLLRHPRCVSPLEDFTTGGFREVIDDASADPAKVKRVLLCTGKIYYELLERKEKTAREDIAIVRIEQLAPFPAQQLRAVLDRYPHATKRLWVQEEPRNMGYWAYLLRMNIAELGVISRRVSASPATGYAKEHQKEQKQILDQAFGPEENA